MTRRIKGSRRLSAGKKPRIIGMAGKKPRITKAPKSAPGKYKGKFRRPKNVI